MKIAAITPTRGDRPQFVEHCKYLMQNQTRVPDKHYIIDFPPINDECDIVPRIKKGIELAKADGMDIICIIEDDDFYSPEYIETVENIFKTKDVDLVGYEKTIYYHLKVQGKKEFIHPGRSSLFCTSFLVEALKGYDFPADSEPYLDIHLWNYAKNRLKTHLSTKLYCIGIKHGIGKSGGNGHNPDNLTYDFFPFNKISFAEVKTPNFYKKIMRL